MSLSTVEPLHDRIPMEPNWREALRNAVRSSRELLALLELEPSEVDWLEPGDDEFPLLVPRGFIGRMNKRDPFDPLLRQVLPSRAETDGDPRFGLDPLGELAVTRAGVMEKYSARALLVTTAACPLHCRYCFRRHFPYEAQSASRADWEAAISLLRDRTDLREVILSGGDPLSLSNRRLGNLLEKLDSIDSLAAVRIHSRFPVVVPERVDAGLSHLLERTRLRTVLVIHANHANEIDGHVEEALKRVKDCGTLILNQSVLLRGINDSADRLEALSYRLLSAGVLPYYLHQLDPVAGASHYAVEDRVAMKLIAHLRTRLPGYLVPRLVRETPGELSKTPLA